MVQYGKGASQLRKHRLFLFFADAPQPHNLLGIYYELGGEIDLARRHYRAAYSLDPTFSPACRNLEQISLALSNERPRIFDFGEAFC